MKTIIAGSRGFTDYQTLSALCDLLVESDEIVTGGARGADALGEKYAKQKGLKHTLFPADWNKRGKKAGYLRNKDMAKYADRLLAFWDGESRGTKHMIDLARQYELEVFIHHY